MTKDKVVVDTCVFIEEIRRGSKMFEKLIEKIEEIEILVPSVVLMELWAGKSMDNDENVKIIKRYLSGMRIIDVDSEIAMKAGKLIRNGMENGIDALVAGVCLNENAKLVAEDTYQKDSYYVPAHRDFLAVKYPFEWLRLRKSKKGMFITYKHFFPENAKKTDYCDEFETKIDNFEGMKKMFKNLDFKEAVIVEKSRTVWIFEGVEIAIDEVSNLGFYIELEATGNFKDSQDGKSYLYQILKKLNIEVGEEDLRGYPFRILENKGYKFGE